MRDNGSSIGPTETKQSYAYTSQKRNEQRQKVYSVNIPFSKYNNGPQSPKPASAQVNTSDDTATHMMRRSGGFSMGATAQSQAMPFATGTGNSFRPESKNGAIASDAMAARNANKQIADKSSVKMKFPENSPYNSASKGHTFKPNQNRKEAIIGAKKAEFQAELLKSSFKFTFDERMKALQYNNNAGGGGDKDMIYQMKAEATKKEQPWAEVHDKESKNYLTQMQTLNSSTPKHTRSGSLRSANV